MDVVQIFEDMVFLCNDLMHLLDHFWTIHRVVKLQLGCCMGVAPLFSNVVFLHGPIEYWCAAPSPYVQLTCIQNVESLAPGCLTDVSGSPFHQIIMGFEFGSAKISVDFKHSKLSLSITRQVMCPFMQTQLSVLFLGSLMVLQTIIRVN